MFFQFSTVACILTVHWLADFCLQTHDQAQNKSKDIKALLCHCATYTFALFLAFGFQSWQLACWAVFNGLSHLLVDHTSSKITAKLYAEQRYHDFFVAIGADQLVHCLFLLATFYMCGKA